MTEVVGHEVARQRLWASLARDRLHHALLFEGPHGVGRRRVATLLAMAANCAADGLPTLATHPCGRCTSCRSVLARSHPDVLWVEPDPSKAGGLIAIEDVREALRRTAYHRYTGRRRFVIVDPAEALAEPAANALLKTLEEPPADTHFVLITARSGALLPTIRSRCQTVRFGPVPAAALEAWLTARGVADAPLRARLCEGRPGLAIAPDGISDRVAARDEVLRLVRADATVRLAWSGKALAGGRAEWATGIDRLLDAVEDVLRDVAVVGAAAQVELVSADRRVDIEALAAAMWPGGVTRAASALRACREQLAVYVQGRAALDALFATLAEEAAVA